MHGCTCLQLCLQLCPLALLRIEDLQVLIQFCLSMVLLLLLRTKGEMKVHPHGGDSACCHEGLRKGFEDKAPPYAAAAAGQLRCPTAALLLPRSAHCSLNGSSRVLLVLQQPVGAGLETGQHIAAHAASAQGAVGIGGLPCHWLGNRRCMSHSGPAHMRVKDMTAAGSQLLDESLLWTPGNQGDCELKWH